MKIPTKSLLAVWLFCFSAIALCAQGTNIPEGQRAYPILDRLEILNGTNPIFHSTIQPVLRRDAVAFARLYLNNHKEQEDSLSGRTRSDIQYIFDDNNEWLAAADSPTTLAGEAVRGDLAIASEESPHYRRNKRPLFGIFYKTPANFFELNKKFFHLRANPILDFRLARATNDDELIFTNRRGLEIRGGVDDRIFFYTNVLETQARFADYVTQRIRRDDAVPGAGLYKGYKSSIFDITNGFDFLNAQAYVGFNVTRHVGVQFGHGRNFVGNGYRSMLLSDFANNYFFLKLNWRVWNFHLQNIIAELVVEPNRSGGDQINAKKYFAAHYFEYKVTPQLSLGLFETTVFSRNNQFELQYLNPVILYRTVEHTIGSPDNVLLGLNGKWNLLRRFQVYGQFVFDEFKFNELFLERRGWWANKFGWQLGLKYVNAFGVNQLDMQVEWNGARPYTYTHRDSSATYSHYNQPLAHPLGANFKEWIVTARYQPAKHLFLNVRYLNMFTGEDGKDQNFGSNILRSYNSREMDYGNKIGQGRTADIGILGVDASYQIYHNIFFEAEYFRRVKTFEESGETSTTQYIGGGIRMNIGRTRMDF